MYLLNKRVPDSNKYINVYTKSRIKTSKIKERIKKETLLDSNPYLQEVFHVYLNKFENAVTHLFLVILGNN